MCRVVTCFVGRGCLLQSVHSLGKTLLAFGLLRFFSKAKLACYSRYLLTSYFCIPVPMMKRTSFFGKLEVVEQEMARVYVNILGISELKWTGMGDYNSDNHYIYYCGRESIRRNGVAILVKKESKMEYLDAISKTTERSLFVSTANHSISR